MEFKTFAESYKYLLERLSNEPDFESNPRKKRSKEILNYQYTIKDPTSNIFANERRMTPFKYLKGEILWYFSGVNSIDFIKRYSKFWEGITNDDGTVNSAYGYNIFEDKNEHGITEWEWAKMQLIQDADSRQSIMRFNKPQHSYLGNKDFVCTMYGIFHVRENKLYFTIHQRSCDVIRGLTFDEPFFTILQQGMLEVLNNHSDTKYELGSFTHVIDSVHLYEEHFDLVKEMLDHNFVEIGTPELDLPIKVLRDYSQKFVKSGTTSSLLINSKFIEWLADH